MGFSQRLAPEFYQRLHRDVRARMEEKGIGLLILDAADDVLYTTGFSFRPNERPVALALTATDAILLIPELEREHAAPQDVAAETLVYFGISGRRPGLFAARALDRRNHRQYRPFLRGFGGTGGGASPDSFRTTALCRRISSPGCGR
ncbi:aminopeptidase P family N-terminal domain-containing protein (plasmid) [Neorhizobium galegae]|nr:aminopeptidase P family N-terminal domain-containing protein [Neorhizobium galegae]